MKRIAITLAALLIPAAAFALDFTNSANKYSDAPFDTATTAGISVLTNLGAISGNPDGAFAPNRPVNRAEFLKILFLSDPTVLVSADDAADCFPDVHASDWFSRYVCLAKTRNTVGGYPDGTFKPAQTVNYAEALKMLGELYTITDQSKTDTWYAPYAAGAADVGVALPDAPAFDAPLTRGQVARLVSAYRAESDGQLAQYRAFERGEAVSLSSSSSSASSVSSASSSSVSSEASSPSSSASSSSSLSTALFPAQSHFLMTGTQTPVIADGVFTSGQEDATIRFIDFEFRQEVKSVDHLVLVDGSGMQIATLTLATNDNSNNTKWHGQMSATGAYVLHKGVPTTLGLEAVLKNVGAGGLPNELVNSLTFSITTRGDSGTTYNLVPTPTDYPSHQVSDADLTGVRNAGSGSAVLTAGLSQLIGQFAVSGKTSTGGEVILEGMNFVLSSSGVTVSHIRIGGPAVIQQSDCSVDASSPDHVLCPVIPSMYQSIGTGPTIISVYADVSLAAGHTSGSLQVTFAGRGTVGQKGAIQWSDNVGHYTWIEPSAPLENGTMWTVGE